MDLDKSNSFEPDGDELLFDLGTVRKGTPEFETTGYEKSLPFLLMPLQVKVEFV